MKRREFILGFGGAAAWPLVPRAQQGVRRLGILAGFADSDADARARITALRKKLEELGWTAGHNIQIDERWAGGDSERTRAYAGELVRLTPNVIVGVAVSAVVALLHETRTIPIVFTQVSD